MRVTLHRERAKNRPSVPESLTAASYYLTNNKCFESIYKGSVHSSDGKTAIILSTSQLLRELALSSEIFVDGTFAVSKTIIYNYIYEQISFLNFISRAVLYITLLYALIQILAHNFNLLTKLFERIIKHLYLIY